MTTPIIGGKSDGTETTRNDLVLKIEGDNLSAGGIEGKRRVVSTRRDDRGGGDEAVMIWLKIAVVWLAGLVLALAIIYLAVELQDWRRQRMARKRKEWRVWIRRGVFNPWNEFLNEVEPVVWQTDLPFNTLMRHLPEVGKEFDGAVVFGYQVDALP